MYAFDPIWMTLAASYSCVALFALCMTLRERQHLTAETSRRPLGVLLCLLWPVAFGVLTVAILRELREDDAY